MYFVHFLVIDYYLGIKGVDYIYIYIYAQKNIYAQKGGINIPDHSNLPGTKRVEALTKGTKVKTFCCKDKKDKGDLGTSDTNVGSDCKPSVIGQCTPMQYKFRCYDTETNPDGSVGDRDYIYENGRDDCKYVAGMTGKLVSSVGNIFGGSNGGRGGKRKSKKQHKNASKKRRTNKRK